MHHVVLKEESLLEKKHQRLYWAQVAGLKVTNLANEWVMEN